MFYPYMIIIGSLPTFMVVNRLLGFSGGRSGSRWTKHVLSFASFTLSCLTSGLHPTSTSLLNNPGALVPPSSEGIWISPSPYTSLIFVHLCSLLLSLGSPDFFLSTSSLFKIHNAGECNKQETYKFQMHVHSLAYWFASKFADQLPWESPILMWINSPQFPK
jgi:hypothetical protein